MCKLSDLAVAVSQDVIGYYMPTETLNVLGKMFKKKDK